MSPVTAILDRLGLLVDRLSDADTLAAADCSALRAMVAEIYKILTAADFEAARQQIGQFELLIGEFIQADKLDPSVGSALVETAELLLSEISQ